MQEGALMAIVSGLKSRRDLTNFQILMKFKTDVAFRKIRYRARMRNPRTLADAGRVIQMKARSLVKSKAKRPSAPGNPPRSRTGRLRKAILYGVEKARQSVVIGPAFHMVHRVGMAHEHGVKFRGDKFRKRPFMGPALKKVRTKLAKHWRGSVR